MPIAILTGGSRGIGKNSALQIAEKGIDLIITYQSKKDAVDETVSEIEQLGQKAVALQLDISNTKSFDSFVSNVKDALKATWQTDRFQFLVNNAGIGLNVPLAEATEEQFDNIMNIHLKGPLFLTQKLLPIMEDGGRIVNISSGLARFTLPGMGIYGSMKAGLEQLTRYMAKELGDRKIAANIVAPGAIETDFGGGFVRDNKEVNQFIASQTALGRVGLPDDVGGVIASLLTDEMRWVNAQRIEVSGGVNL